MNRNTPTPIAYLIVAFCALFAAISIISFSEGDLASLESSIRRNLAQVTSTVYESAKYEAESGALTAPMAAISDANALGGTYVSSKTVDEGSVTIPITVSKAGTYFVWGRVLSPTYSNDSFYVSVDGGAKDIWDTAEGLWSPKWQWTRVTGRALNGNSPVQLNATGRPFQLAAGVHNITFQNRDAQSTLDAIVVTNDPSFVPTDAQPVPEIKKVTLTVSTAGTGSGTISGGTINCGTVCSQTTTAGNTLSVSAVAATGSTFSGWSGACSGITQCTIVMNDNVSVIANFTANPVVTAPTQPAPTPTDTTTSQTTTQTTTNPAPAAVTVDTNPPSTPTNLRALFIAKTSVSLAWDIPSDNVGVTGYVVYRNNTKVATIATNTYLDIARKPGITYVYTVTATDAAGNVSPVSASLTVTTIPTSTLLFKVGDQVLVTSATNVRSAAGSNRKLLGTQQAGALGRISTGPVWTSGYWWWNINFDTGTDGWAIENYLTKYAPTSTTADTTAPSTPTNLRTSSVSTSEINVTWNTSTDNVGVVGYKLYRNGSLITTQAANSYADTGLQAGTSYSYTVGAYDAVGNTSSLTAPVTGSTLTQPVTQTYTLTVSKSGTGSGSVTGGSVNCGSTCSQTANSGTSITLTATPAAGSTFIGWSGACSGTSATCSVSLTGDTSVAAQFDTTPIVVSTYTLTVSTTGTGSGTVAGGSINCGSTCTQTANAGTAITLTATAASGSTFSGWSGACSGTSATCSVTLNANTTVSASFTQNVVVTPPPTPTGVWYAATNGSASGAGTLASPWDLKTALSGGNGKIVAGNTLYVRGGTYKGAYESKLQGTPSQPIMVKNYNGERVTIDGNDPSVTTSTQAFSQTLGGYVWYFGFEITNTNPQRVFTPLYVSAPDGRAGGVSILAPGVKIINFVVHDASDGISAWVPATDFEAYGNLVYNVGWEGPNGYNGHGFYAQNTTTQKLFENNISVNNFKYTAQLYGKQAGLLNNFVFRKNIFFNPNTIMLGGSSSTALDNILFDENYLYNDSVQVGYMNAYNQNIRLTNNYISIKGDTNPTITLSKNVTFTGNSVYSTDGTQLVLLGLDALPTNVPSDFTFDNNTYGIKLPSPGPAFYIYNGGTQGICRGVWFTDPGNQNKCVPETAPIYTWQTQLNYDKNSTFSYSLPTQPKIFLNKKDAYDAGRANVAIFNWDKRSTIVIPNSMLQGTLAVGDSYEIRSALDYYGDVKTGTYTSADYANGGISVSMLASDHTVAMPVGYSKTLGPNTFPDFGAFIIIKK